jgi:hypothetical protein
LADSCCPSAYFTITLALEWRFNSHARVSSLTVYNALSDRKFSSSIGYLLVHHCMPDTDNSPPLPPPAPGIEFIFLGTGTSGSLPNVSCLTAPESATPCKTCLSTLKPEGKKNIRRNTSTVMRIEGKDGEMKFVFPTITPQCGLKKGRTIVIDVGKNFQAAAVEWFPKYGLRRIDAVLITHAHADGAPTLMPSRLYMLMRE